MLLVDISIKLKGILEVLYDDLRILPRKVRSKRSCLARATSMLPSLFHLRSLYVTLGTCSDQMLEKIHSSNVTRELVQNPFNLSRPFVSFRSR